MQLQSGLFFPLLLLFVVPSNSISESLVPKFGAPIWLEISEKYSSLSTIFSTRSSHPISLRPFFKTPKLVGLR